MNTSAAQLLRILGSGVRPAGIGVSVGNAGAAGAAPGAFADLLEQARSGGLASELPVTIGSDAAAAGVQLSDDQMARLALAADQLETSGVRQALITIDGQKLLMNVQSREITGRPESAGGPVGGIDGVLDLGDARGGAGVALDGSTGAQGAVSGLRRIGPPAGTLTGSASVLNLLAGLGRARPAGGGS